MDVRLQGNSQLHHAVNGSTSRNSRPSKDNNLHYLSREEQECIQFFEETIGSLEESMGEEQQGLGQRRPSERNSRPVGQVDGLSSLAQNREVLSHDIIDLVHPKPDSMQAKEPIFSTSHPDFNHILPLPERHFEAKLRHDNFPSEYNAPLRSASFGPTDSHPSYHPPGSVPTPVLIAQKIAENQGDGTSNMHPSSLLCRLSIESDKTPRDRSNISVKHGPPTSTKSTHYPPNINVVLGGKEHQKPVSNVNIYERQEQMLANLAGTSNHPLEDNSQQGVEQDTQNSPSCSISFTDPAPDKSRMEALSKLGLTRDRPTSLQITPGNSPKTPFRGQDTRALSPDTSQTLKAEISTDIPEPDLPIPPPTFFNDDKNTEIFHKHSFSSHDKKGSKLNPSSPKMSQKRYPSPPPAEVTFPAFNSFGGKSIVVHPPLSQKNEPATSPSSSEHKNLPFALSNSIELNPYGGKSKAMTPATTAIARTNLPDILSSHIDTRETIPAKPDPQPVESNKYGGKSRCFDPVSGLYRTSESQSKSVKPPPPTPAPRPPRHSYHGVVPAQKPPARASSPEYRRRPSSTFRPQGITVQFCGRGAMNESRREALKRLGLLKNS
ncbi:hypothetical protein CHARACLAT_000205 [Characodon lateralis]|uniref:Proline and serine-rich protein 2 n=1 Tax=Characodon lateralis TaxID=208331 RepID=A0ABU7CWH3_9TELE|nr:hypothetical protein [Characodon lateralis]